MRKKHKIM